MSCVLIYSVRGALDKQKMWNQLMVLILNSSCIFPSFCNAPSLVWQWFNSVFTYLFVPRNVYVCTCVCAHVSVYVHVVCVCASVWCVCICVCVWLCVCVCKHTHLSHSVCVRTCMYVCACVSLCVEHLAGVDSPLLVDWTQVISLGRSFLYLRNCTRSRLNAGRKRSADG